MSGRTANAGGPSAGGQVLAGQPGAGAEGVTVNAASVANNGQPDQTGQPRGNPGPAQSNDSLIMPAWTEQVSSKLASDPESAARLAGFKTLDDLVRAYLDAPANPGGQPAIPGADSAPEDIQAFYERLGKPKEAAGYPFAKDSPELAAAFFDANLTADQAQAVYAANLAALDVARNGLRAALARDFQATDALLRAEYGQRYGEALTLMQRGLGNSPSTGKLSPVAQSLMDAGLAGKPEIVRAFIELGRAAGESAAPSGGSQQAGRPESVMAGRGFDY